MQSSVWGGVPTVAAASGAADPAALLNSQLANALSTMGDAHFWEESISPSTIRTSLASSDPSNPNSTPTLLRGMKWLLASISKGRNVSDFYPHVVKLVGASSLEVRKMVYMFLVQYADHDSTTRELSLLSINSFQRGLADPEQLIRALALRVLTSIRVSDIVQIQILGVQKCASDKSPYVRKCAANALAKLHNQCCSDQRQKRMLEEIMKTLLDTDDSSMVLTSAVIAFVELCPERLELLHTSYRRLCNQLVDMDEWGQVVIIDVLQRYCRKFFCAPSGIGSAEAIDAERRVVRTMQGIKKAAATAAAAARKSTDTNSQPVATLPPRVPLRKVKRRVVKKGFYSDEEDESTEEEVYPGSGGTALPVAAAARQHALLSTSQTPNSTVKDNDLEDEHLDEDHRLLLRSTLPLLKSRNSAVVLAVCSLHYYCGVASIRVRSSLGKAMVRIHRDRREIQYAVLTAIKALVKECPSAFTPFLQDFYVKGMDPSFTRLIKLDILTLLALEPNSIDAVLMELRTYVRHDDDKPFCCAAIRAVGKVAELARIVHDRHGQNTGNVEKERKQANSVALNALYGLLTLTRASSDPVIVGECSIVMERILLQLSSDNDGNLTVDDPNRIQEESWKRLLLLLVWSLSSRPLEGPDEHDEEENGDGKSTFRIPPLATAATLWIMGDWLSSPSGLIAVCGFDRHAQLKTRLELSRLIARAFPSLATVEKLQSIHFASKLLIASDSPQEAAVCEFILSIARADVLADVRDRARMESNLIHISRGLQYDSDNITANASGIMVGIDLVKNVLLSSKPPSSSLPLQDEDEENVSFRFGTLSSLVNRRAKAAYLPLPKWADTNSPSSLRDGPKTSSKSGGAGVNKQETTGVGGWKVDSSKTNSEFYESDNDESGDDDSDDDDSDAEADESDWNSDEEDDDDDDDSSDDDGDNDEDTDDSEPAVRVERPVSTTTSQAQARQPVRDQISALTGVQPPQIPIQTTALVDKVDDDDADDSDEISWDEDDESEDDVEPLVATSNLLGMSQQHQALAGSSGLSGLPQQQPMMPLSTSKPTQSNGSYAQGLEGLVMAPVVLEAREKVDPDIERDSSTWVDLIRPELGGGLYVKARHLRGPTRDLEARLIGLNPSSPAVVLIQLQFRNMRTDLGVLRRVRIVSRSTTSGYIGPKRTAVPAEIAALGKNQMADAILGLEFASVSDREGSLQARLDVKSDRGTNPLDLRPPLTELVQPLEINENVFDDNMNRMQGFQRVVSDFAIPANQVVTLDSVVLKHIALLPLDKKTWQAKRRLRLVGQLPASTDKLYIVVECDDNGTGSLTVCCDNAIANNSILDTLKKALK